MHNPCKHVDWVYLTLPAWLPLRSDIDIVWCRDCGATKLKCSNPKSVLGLMSRWRSPRFARKPVKVTPEAPLKSSDQCEHQNTKTVYKDYYSHIYGCNDCGLEF